MTATSTPVYVIMVLALAVADRINVDPIYSAIVVVLLVVDLAEGILAKRRRRMLLKAHEETIANAKDALSRLDRDGRL